MLQNLNFGQEKRLNFKNITETVFSLWFSSEYVSVNVSLP